MDTLQKALELSRAQRAVRFTVATPAERAPAPDPEPAAPVRRTRTVPVDAAVLRAHRVLAPQSADAVGQSFKMLRTQVLRRMRQEGYRSLAIVSPTAHDGRTTVAVNLATAIAEDADHTALLVDFDLRQPRVQTCFGLQAQPGVEDCLRGRTELADALVQPAGYSKLVLLPGSGPVAQSSELLASEQTGRLVRELVGRYANRIVLFDLPPLLVTDDALAVLPRLDAVLVVAREGRTRRDDLQRCLVALRDRPVVGTVLNAAREPSSVHP